MQTSIKSGLVLVEVSSLEKIMLQLEDLNQKVSELQEQNAPGKLCSVKEAAKLIGISENRVYHLVYDQKLKGHQLHKGGKLQIVRKDIERYLSKNLKSAE